MRNSRRSKVTSTQLNELRKQIKKLVLEEIIELMEDGRFPKLPKKKPSIISYFKKLTRIPTVRRIPADIANLYQDLRDAGYSDMEARRMVSDYVDRAKKDAYGD